MKQIFALAFAAGLSLTAISTSQAAPVAPVNPSSDIVIQVAGGCGAGWHRGPNGGCLRNWVGGPGPGYRVCPRGYHRGPYGGCRRNW
ncbi:MAG TPA: hypothetical protein VGM57_14435 [Pseudolabrys sp.]|jgi:hypothetical protein